MIKAIEFYHIVEATVPLYVAMVLAYISVKYLKLFTTAQCEGINKFVSKFSVPLLAFRFISETNPYKMNTKLIVSDCIQKLLAFLVLVVATKLRGHGGIKFVITGLSLSTMPNTLIIGVPILKSMYGDESETLLIQIVMLQSLIWYNLLLFLFELNAAKQASGVMPSGEELADQGDKESAHSQELAQSQELAAIDRLEEGRVTQSQELESMDQLEEGRVTQSQELAAIDQFEEGREQRGEENRRPEKHKTMHLLLTVGKKLLLNPNTHAAILGLIVACIKFKLDVKLPKIIQGSIDILADGGLGMAMFSLGLFMASQNRIMACGIRLAMVAMGMRFVVGPVLMVAPSLALRLKGTLLRVSIVQAALPQGIVPFVFAQEYNVHPHVLSTGVIFGMLVAVPVTLVYYLILDI